MKITVMVKIAASWSFLVQWYRNGIKVKWNGTRGGGQCEGGGRGRGLCLVYCKIENIN